MRIDRRDFIRLLGTAVGGAALATTGFGQVYEVPEKLLKKVEDGPGIVTWKSTICGMCPAGCGLKIKTVDGMPVYVKGNPNYPVNSGGVCPAAHGSLETLFHPERLKSPMKRIGIAAGNKFEPISWDEAIQIISKKLKQLRNVGKPESLAFLGSKDYSLSMKAASDFMKAYGSPNFFEFSFDSNNNAALNLQTGITRNLSYDISNADVVLTLGANILETELSPIFYTKQVSGRKDSSEGLVKFIHAGSRQDLTGMSAHLFVPVKPETMGAFALGLAYVLIREEMIDSKFVSSHTFGYDNWRDASGKMHEGFKDYVLKNYYPERVSQITGAPSSTLLYVARQLGNNKRSIVIGGDLLNESVNGVFTQMSVNSLNALLGNFGKEGGVHLFPELNNGASGVVLDSTSKKGLKKYRADNAGKGKFSFSDFSISQFTKNVNDGVHYPIGMLFMYKGNPIFQALNKHELGEALKKIPLVVSFDSFMNESNIYADLILPVDSFLEEWDEFSDTPGVPFQHAGIRQPIVEKFHDTRQMVDVLISVGKNIGGAPAKTFKTDSFEELVKANMNKIFDSGVGAVTTEKIEGHWLNFIQQRGWHAGRYQSFNEFWELLLKNGGWWNPNTKPIATRKMFSTKSKKFEFYSTALENAVASSGVDESTALDELHITARGDVVYLPHFEAPKETEGKSLKLVMFRNNINRDGSNANLPLLQEMFGIGIRYYWGTWVEMNKITAKKNRVEDNDDIWISSESGSIKARVRIIPSMPDDVVAVPFGMGHHNYGKYADGYGSNPTTIIKNQYDMISGKPAYQSTEVSISKINEGA